MNQSEQDAMKPDRFPFHAARWAAMKSFAGGRPMLALYRKEDGVSPPKSSLALAGSLGNQVIAIGVDRAHHDMLQEQPRFNVDAIDE